ncbi:hypothetical protein BDY21DRAFT_135441 [Lineolata rhizophorae]|uniref:Secreted protein n=1 Tax=Lineolata rhizophorae TaxID=578093 RepID=A0A6A6PBX8_9PEZI|nr:hypothetical protein BDY21DRAFT_135441 [Lineolata rhizophorae]
MTVGSSLVALSFRSFLLALYSPSYLAACERLQGRLSCSRICVFPWTSAPGWALIFTRGRRRRVDQEPSTPYIRSMYIACDVEISRAPPWRFAKPQAKAKWPAEKQRTKVWCHRLIVVAV